MRNFSDTALESEGEREIVITPERLNGLYELNSKGEDPKLFMLGK